jgi:hypothetical protein
VILFGLYRITSRLVSFHSALVAHLKYLLTFLVVVLGGQALEHPEWPLAKDDRGAWIPLELLVPEPGQPLLRCGHLQKALLAKVRDFIRRGGCMHVRQETQRFVQAFSGVQIGLVSFKVDLKRIYADQIVGA